MKPGAEYALRRVIESMVPLLEAALELLGDEEGDDLPASPDPVAKPRPTFFGEEPTTPAGGPDGQA